MSYIEFNATARCPYCGKDVEITGGLSQKAYGRLDTVSVDTELCDNCEKEFAFDGFALIRIETYKISKYEKSNA